MTDFRRTYSVRIATPGEELAAAARALFIKVRELKLEAI
jgi:hypothetical protein